ncbi:MAG: polysaccharide deacetylase family protein [Vicinamibacteria bacterium]
MKIRGMWRLKRWVSRAAALLRPSVAILMYHRVHDAVTDPWDLCVSPAHFNEQMEYLRRHYAVLSLPKLIELIAAGRLPRRAVVLTFDDGYADNLFNAKPILDRWDLPATFFVTTGNLGQSREFWWDVLSRLFLEPGRLPASLNIRLNREILSWELGGSAVYTDKDCRCHSTWRANGTDDPTPRHVIVRALNKRLYKLPEIEKRQILDQLFTWANASPEGRPSSQTLSPEELICVEDGGLVDVGAHSVTHPVLSALPAATQRDEITLCKFQLEEILGHKVSSFCYPHGAYTAETVALVRSAAFTSACSVVSRPVGPNADPFQLPRIHIRDWDGYEFGRQLRTCMNSQ